jgi:hypothetical protein
MLLYFFSEMDHPARTSVTRRRSLFTVFSRLTWGDDVEVHRVLNLHPACCAQRPNTNLKGECTQQRVRVHAISLVSGCHGLARLQHSTVSPSQHGISHGISLVMA